MTIKAETGWYESPGAHQNYRNSKCPDPARITINFHRPPYRARSSLGSSRVVDHAGKRISFGEDDDESSESL